MSNWYLEKLKSPHWQRMRCEVMQRDNFTCTRCGATEKQLHVHHLSYAYGKDPWDYSLDNFCTLCMDCHEVETNNRKLFTKPTLDDLRADRQLASELVEQLLAEYEDYLHAEHLSDRGARLAELEEKGATFDSDGRYYSSDGKLYDEEGNPM